MSEQALVICGESALAAIRCHRRRYARLSWDPLSAAEQRHVLAACIPNANTIDWDALAIAGVWAEGAPLHVLTGGQSNRRKSPGIISHSMSNGLPGECILRVERGLYITSPALTLASLCNSLDYGEARGLAEELTGRVGLSEIDDGVHACEPAMTPRQLVGRLKALTNTNGVPKALAVAAHCVGEARSPMEAIMFGMFSTPMAQGGLACYGCEPNARVLFGHDAALVSQMPYAICDLLYRRAGKTLEYNGAYHAENQARKHDERRTAGLAAMGIGTIPINDEILSNLDALTAIAKTLYKCEDRQFRIRTKDFGLKQRNLLNGLRRWYRLPPRQ